MEVQNKKRRSRSNKVEFLGWGSKPLIEFLDSIGKESRQYSQLEVDTIVQKYVTSNNLVNPKKKRQILCDEKLYKLFRKKRIPRTKVYHLLDVHFTENHDSSSSSDDDYDESLDEEIMGREEEVKVSSRKPKKKGVDEMAAKSCFAALTPQNIKLIYLKKSLVEDLLKKNPESFEQRVVGSIVRISSAVNYNFSKNPFQLHQVTGIMYSSGCGQTCLRLSNVMADVPISKLQEGNFSEEECEEFQEQVKSGLLKRPTVEEFDLKAQDLHRDITKHWIDKEIKLLTSLINHSNEKGRREQMFEHMKRRQLLQTSTEQERLLSEIPVVAADEPEHEETASGSSEEEEEEEGSCSDKGVAEEPEATLMGASENQKEECSCTPMEAVAEEPEAEAPLMGASEKEEEGCSCSPMDVQKEVEDRANCTGPILGVASDLSAAQGLLPSEGAGNVTIMQPYHPGLTYLGDYAAVLNQMTCMNLQQPPLGGYSALLRNVIVQAQLQQPPLGGHSALLRSVMAQAHLQQPYMGGGSAVVGNGEDFDGAIWHGADHRGFIQGPVSLNALRMWFQQGFLGQDFRVWKTDQNQAQSILLIDLLNSSSSQ